jgi:hypothetical protein
VEQAEVVVAHNQRATLRVGGVLLTIDADQARTDVEAEAMAMAPAPARRSCGAGRRCSRSPPSRGRHSAASASHLPRRRPRGPRRVPPSGRCTARRCRPGPAAAPGELAARLHGECGWLVANGVLPAGLVARSRQLAGTALRPRAPVFTHGGLQAGHVFAAGDEVTGVIGWSEASQGDALFGVAILTLGHEEHLGDVAAGDGTGVDRDLIRAWWSLRCLTNVRWLAEHGYGSPGEFPEVAVLRSQP